MIKRLFLLLVFLPTLVYAQEQSPFPDNLPIFSISIPFDQPLNRTAPFTYMPPGSVVDIQNMKRISPGVSSGWTVRKGMSKHNTTTALNSGENIKSLLQFINKIFESILFVAQVDDSSGADALYVADDDPPSTGTDFSSSSIYSLKDDSGNAVDAHAAFASGINDDWVGTAKNAVPWGWSGGTTSTPLAYPDGFLVDRDRYDAANLIFNSDFEEGSDPPDGWSVTNGTITTESSDPIDGNYMLIDADVGSASVVTYKTDAVVDADCEYGYTVYAKETSGSNSTIVLKNYDSGDNWIKGSSDAACITVWSVRIDNFTTHSDSSYLEIQFDVPAGEELQVDKVRVFSYYQSNFDRIYDDGYDEVRNTDADEQIVFTQDKAPYQYAYIGYRRQLNGVYLDIDDTTFNATAGVLRVEAMRDGEWTPVSGLSDGTSSGGATLAQDGTVTWTANSSDEPFMMYYHDDHLFWYRFSVTTDIDNGVAIETCKVIDDCQVLFNLPYGTWQGPDGVSKDVSGTYTDIITNLIDEDTSTIVALDSFASTDEVYIGSVDRLCAIEVTLGTDDGDENAGSQSALTVKYWNAENNAWTSVGTVFDGTDKGTEAYTDAWYSRPIASLTKDGVVQWWDTDLREAQRTIDGQEVPMYWYQLSWDATLDSQVEVAEINVLPKPDIFGEYDGVIEFEKRAYWWPSISNKGGLDYSTEGFPHLFNGSDAGGTGQIFGDGSVNSAVLFEDNLIVSTENPYALYNMSGSDPSSLTVIPISYRVGTIAPHSMVALYGNELFSTESLSNVVCFLWTAGVFMTDGITLVDISGPVSDYFDESSAPYIEKDYMYLSYAWVNSEEQTVHFAVPINTSGSGTQTTLNRELVFSYATNEWYDIYNRSSAAACGLELLGSGDEMLTYIGDYSGYVYRTNTGTADGTTEIDHYVKTSSFNPLKEIKPDYMNYKTKIRGIKLKAGVDSTSGSEAKIYSYLDGGTLLDTSYFLEGDVSLERSNYSYINGFVRMNRTVEEVAFKFNNESVTDSVMKLYGFTIDFQAIRSTY